MHAGFPSRVGRCLLLLIGLTLGWLTIADDTGPVILKGKGEQCVAETDFMRRNHMDLIVHQRDETVIRGIRDEPFSLVECVDCHVQRDAENNHIRVDADGQFCASCHEYVAAKIDCFGCHAAVPDADKQESVDGRHWLPNRRLVALLSRTSAPSEPAVGHNQNELNTTSSD